MNELILEAKKENLPRVISFVSEYLQSPECSPKTRMQIELAIEELFINIASYAYYPHIGEVTVRVETENDPYTVTVTFADSGAPYDPLAKADPDVTLPAEKRRIGGLGILLVKKTMDDVIYAYRDGKNILSIKKRIG